MKIRKIALVTLLVSVSLLASCNNGNTNSQKNLYKDEEKYEDKETDVYQTSDATPSSKYNLRFYEKTPHVPYVDVQDFFKTFFSHDDYTLTRDDYIYVLKNNRDSVIQMDSKYNVLTLKYAHEFSDHKQSIQTTGLSFLKVTDVTISGYADKIIPLDNYGIDIHSEDDKAYMPLSFLSLVAGGSWLYNIIYNGKDIYVYDRQGLLSDGVSRDITYYGDAYTSSLTDYSTPRYQDVAEYTYGQLCCTFDHFRGYTSQLVFGDNNLLTIGTNGILEEYYPNIKSLLLSLDKKEYYAGYNLLLAGMFDGGHTLTLMGSEDPDYGLNCISNNLDTEKYASEIDFYTHKFIEPLILLQTRGLFYGAQKASIFPYVPQVSPNIDPKLNYYYFDESTKTAYVGFDNFNVDENAWNEFYKNKKDPSQAPVETDTYAYIRSCFYQALDDRAENLVLDLTTNGGGSSSALLGIMGLFNKGKSYMGMNNTQNRSRTTEYCDVDINLDGKWDNLDVEEASKFDFNFGVMTSRISFSCGNLLPSLLKELGIKIIGERSSGGSCSIVLNSTCDGLVFAHSSELCLSNANGENIDSGIPVDLQLKVVQDETNPAIIHLDEFYDLPAIGNYLSTVYSE